MLYQSYATKKTKSILSRFRIPGTESVSVSVRARAKEKSEMSISTLALTLTLTLSYVVPPGLELFSQ